MIHYSLILWCFLQAEQLPRDYLLALIAKLYYLYIKKPKHFTVEKSLNAHL